MFLQTIACTFVKKKMQLQSDLLQDLKQRTKKVLTAAEVLLDLPLDELNYKPDPDTWSALECLEHLNRYGDFYLPEISHRIQSGSEKKNDLFRSGWLGNYFAKSMLPKEKLNKMKTFKSMNPNGSRLDKSTIDTFIDQQHQMLRLLTKADAVSITHTKTSISISKWIKLRLGDTFRVVIYHNQRHIVQAQKVLTTHKPAENAILP